MKELINIKNEEAVTTSVLIAEKFHKRHDKLLSEIERKYSEIMTVQNGGAKFFIKGKYKNRGKEYPMYYVTRDGYALLVMSFTGKEALEWKLKFIEAFNQMENYINFVKADKQIQKNSMKFLQDNLQMPTTKDYMKANTIANKCVSNMFGYPKMVKKDDMSWQMKEAREPVLKDTCELMAFNDKYDLGIKVSDKIYKKYEVV